MRKFVRKLNFLFIQAVLIPVYIFAIGISAVLYFIFGKKQKKESTFWQKAERENFDLKYLESPY